MRIPMMAAATAALVAAGCAMTLQERVSSRHGAALFAQECAACHGAGGTGYAGPARDWTPPPDLTTLARRNGGTFPQLAILSTIDGLERHGQAGAIMPEFGAGDMGPTVVVEMEEGVGTPIPADLIALGEHLRSIQR